jgi:hypothetical protein
MLHAGLDLSRRRVDVHVLTGLQRVVRERPGSAGAIEVCFPHTVRVCPAQEILARLYALASTRKASRI